MPTRYIKQGICDSKHIDLVSAEAERLWTRLLVNVDDFGRCDARLPIIKAKCFPLKESLKSSCIEKWIKELVEHKLANVYTCMDDPYLQLLRWDNKPRASESHFPAYNDECIQMYTDVPLTETKHKHKHKHKHKEASKARPSSPDEVTEYATLIGFTLDGSQFIDYMETRGWKLKGGQAVKDWKACVRTWKRYGANNGINKQSPSKSGADNLAERYGHLLPTD